ncbi:MAG: hypothetical protein M3227_00235 [Thermoproteota archaeon]|nr:hypothetical protein [Thermoproteota archaeon]
MNKALFLLSLTLFVTTTIIITAAIASPINNEASVIQQADATYYDATYYSITPSQLQPSSITTVSILQETIPTSTGIPGNNIVGDSTLLNNTEVFTDNLQFGIDSSSSSSINSIGIILPEEICGDGIDNNNNGPVDEGCNIEPDCSTVTPNLATLWPPDHHMEQISIGGATDPNGDLVALVITDIIQDEPINGLGDGDQVPDAALVDGDTVQLRSERAENGDGRIYYISFTADDGKGGICNGVVAVSIPLDQSGNIPAVDSGTYFYSLQ